MLRRHALDDGASAAPAVDAAVRRVLTAQPRLERRDPRDLAELVARTAVAWLEPGSLWMQRAVTALAESGPFSRPMLDFGLRRMIEPLSYAALEALVRREIGDWSALEQQGGRRLIVHVLPSNLPGHAAIPSALTLLLRCGGLLKSGRDDRVFAPLWVESICALDPEVGACLEPVYWAGAVPAGALEAALAGAGLVVASGGDAAMADLARRCAVAAIPFIGHGHRISAALVVGDAIERRTAAALADDVALWDQLGCLSPQVCFVEGSRLVARQFAEAVCGELAARATALPSGRRSAGETLDLRRFREAAAWRGFGAGERVLYECGGAGDGSIAIEDEVGLRPTPLHRCLRIVAVERVEEALVVLRTHSRLLEGVGVGVGTDAFPGIANRLREIGAHHVVPLGTMQSPDLSWRQGGRPRIAEWCGAIGMQ